MNIIIENRNFDFFVKRDSGKEIYQKIEFRKTK